MALILGGIIILIAALYVFVLEPFNNSLQGMRNEVPLKRQELVWMQDAVRQVNLVKGPGKLEEAAGKGSLLAIIDQTAAQRKLAGNMKRIEPDDQDRAKVWLEDAVFTDIVLWLRLLEAKGIVAVAYTSESRNAAGIVNAKITLKGSS